MDVADAVGLVMVQEDRFLVEKRKQSKGVAPGKIAIPGGHVEEGETLRQACKRELKEELDLQSDSFEFISAKFYSMDYENQLIFYFVCRDWEGEPECIEADEIFWIPLQDPHELDYGAERDLIKNYLRSLEST